MTNDTDRCRERFERRLTAVERAVGDAPPAADDDERERSDCETSPPLDRRLNELEARVDELDAALQAVRGYLGGVEAVNESVERRADAAVAAVDRLESRLDAADSPFDAIDSSFDGDERPLADDATRSELSGQSASSPTDSPVDPADTEVERTADANAEDAAEGGSSLRRRLRNLR